MRGSAAAHLLGLRIRISPGVWMSISCECCVLSSRGRGTMPHPVVCRPSVCMGLCGRGSYVFLIFVEGLLNWTPTDINEWINHWLRKWSISLHSGPLGEHGRGSFTGNFEKRMKGAIEVERLSMRELCEGSLEGGAPF